jgi:di-N-acetylchitobiase
MYELTQLVESVQSAMHKAIPGSVVSIDVAWSPNCIDDRCYDYAALARVTDLMFIMSYDLPSQVFPPQPCVALPCTPLQGARQGAEAYIELGIPTSVLILGLPWYGFDYPCLMENATAPLCPIPEVPYRGANCSDAAAGQIDYRVLSAQAARATTPVTLDSTSQSLWYNYVNDSQVRQVWMDDADTLRPKYQLAVDLGLIGVGMWNLDGLDYTSADPNVQRQTQAMWEALNVFLKPAAAHGRL